MIKAELIKKELQYEVEKVGDQSFLIINDVIKNDSNDVELQARVAIDKFAKQGEEVANLHDDYQTMYERYEELEKARAQADDDIEKQKIFSKQDALMKDIKKKTREINKMNKEIERDLIDLTRDFSSGIDKYRKLNEAHTTEILTSLNKKSRELGKKHDKHIIDDKKEEMQEVFDNMIRRFEFEFEPNIDFTIDMVPRFSVTVSKTINKLTQDLEDFFSKLEEDYKKMQDSSNYRLAEYFYADNLDIDEALSKTEEVSKFVEVDESAGGGQVINDDLLYIDKMVDDGARMKVEVEVSAAEAEIIEEVLSFLRS